MAMGSKGRREAENAIACCRPFKNSTGSFYGTRGSTRTLGWLESHADARRIRELLGRAVYVVWSYGTPIAFVSETEDGERTAYYVDQSHSMTTSHHQSTARVGMGEYETIGERPRRTRRPARRPARNDAALVAAVGPVYGSVRQPRATEEDPLVPVLAEADARWRELINSPGYQLGHNEDEQSANMRRLLDPRFSDPDWTPFRTSFEGNLPAGAEERDAERVARENAERPWRP